MSQPDARSFVERVATSEAFRRDLMTELQAGAETSPQQLIELGGRHGLTFTANELADVLSELKPGHDLLGDAELEAVSGGAGEALFSMSSLSLQMAMQRENIVFTSISNALKTRHDATKNTIPNFK